MYFVICVCRFWWLFTNKAESRISRRGANRKWFCRICIGRKLVLGFSAGGQICRWHSEVASTMTALHLFRLLFTRIRQLQTTVTATKSIMLSPFIFFFIHSSPLLHLIIARERLCYLVFLGEKRNAHINFHWNDIVNRISWISLMRESSLFRRGGRASIC